MLVSSLLTASAITVQVSADNHTEASYATDSLGYQLELGRHEQLAMIKRDPNNSLAAFTTDGCSGGLSEGWKFIAGKIESFHATYGMQPPWESCCVSHDHLYHTGGRRQATAIESFTARQDADRALKQCVSETGAEKAPELAEQTNLSVNEIQTLYGVVADLMYRAVRIGGVPCSGLPWRWGYGWPECE